MNLQKGMSHTIIQSTFRRCEFETFDGSTKFPWFFTKVPSLLFRIGFGKFDTSCWITIILIICSTTISSSSATSIGWWLQHRFLNFRLKSSRFLTSGFYVLFHTNTIILKLFHLFSKAVLGFLELRRFATRCFNSSIERLILVHNIRHGDSRRHDWLSLVERCESQTEGV